MGIHCGITGTQKGMTDKQKIALVYLLSQIDEEVERYHHGDCIGVDTEFHDFLIDVKCYEKIEIHPCTIYKKRSYRKAPIIHKPKLPLERNLDIVLASDIIIVVPKEFEEQKRYSGTWATYRYAIKNKKK